ncbi:hypothetical protein BX600DRAFT_466601 [Xylariales sp. PMI_506]|nr:hypothetical protein BX600DRAFT_466601 [Xylariales sp. PMI_506]
MRTLKQGGASRALNFIPANWIIVLLSGLIISAPQFPTLVKSYPNQTNEEYGPPTSPSPHPPCSPRPELRTPAGTGASGIRKLTKRLEGSGNPNQPRTSPVVRLLQRPAPLLAFSLLAHSGIARAAC